mmetsp:Transcript_41235/g.47495  ORF Transcript_41235/g.47495 Transcript_41235/m.47495 type:complete len:225 (-) Transcript_41235:1101-1775(-)
MSPFSAAFSRRSPFFETWNISLMILYVSLTASACLSFCCCMFVVSWSGTPARISNNKSLKCLSLMNSWKNNGSFVKISSSCSQRPHFSASSLFFHVSATDFCVMEMSLITPPSCSKLSKSPMAPTLFLLWLEDFELLLSLCTALSKNSSSLSVRSTTLPADGSDFDFEYTSVKNSPSCFAEALIGNSKHSFESSAKDRVLGTKNQCSLHRPSGVELSNLFLTVE